MTFKSNISDSEFSLMSQNKNEIRVKMWPQTWLRIKELLSSGVRSCYQAYWNHLKVYMSLFSSGLQPFFIVLMVLFCDCLGIFKAAVTTLLSFVWSGTLQTCLKLSEASKQLSKPAWWAALVICHPVTSWWLFILLPYLHLSTHDACCLVLSAQEVMVTDTYKIIWSSFVLVKD